MRTLKLENGDVGKMEIICERDTERHQRRRINRGENTERERGEGAEKGKECVCVYLHTHA